MKSGRKVPNKMKQTYFCPIYGDRDDVVFGWSAGPSHQNAVDRLSGFSGILLTDGYDAYLCATAKLNATEQPIPQASCRAHGRRGCGKPALLQPAALGPDADLA